MDGWSVPVLVQELLTLYARRGDGACVAAGDAVPGLSGLDRGAGSQRGGCGLERGAYPVSRSRRWWRRHDRGQAAMLPERIMTARSASR